MMKESFDDQQLVSESIEYLRSRGVLSDSKLKPTVGIILGSGLGDLAGEIESPSVIPYAEIPGFQPSTASGHRGEMCFGFLESVPVVVLSGRLHRYEGWTNQQVTFPVRVLHRCGVRHLIVSNAAGGLNASFRVGDILVIRDSINLLPRTLFPSAPKVVHQSPYSDTLAELALGSGRKHGFTVHQGTYLATLGPSYETRAEYRMMRLLGADCVGMSTVPESLQAQLLDMQVLGLSMISNVARPDSIQETTHQEVIDAGREAQPRLMRMVRDVLRNLGGHSVEFARKVPSSSGN